MELQSPTPKYDAEKELRLPEENFNNNEKDPAYLNSTETNGEDQTNNNLSNETETRNLYLLNLDANDPIIGMSILIIFILLKYVTAGTIALHWLIKL